MKMIDIIVNYDSRKFVHVLYHQVGSSNFPCWARILDAHAAPMFFLTFYYSIWMISSYSQPFQFLLCPVLVTNNNFLWKFYLINHHRDNVPYIFIAIVTTFFYCKWSAIFTCHFFQQGSWSISHLPVDPSCPQSAVADPDGGATGTHPALNFDRLCFFSPVLYQNASK